MEPTINLIEGLPIWNWKYAVLESTYVATTMMEVTMHRTRRETMVALTAASVVPLTLQSATAQTASPLASDDARAIAKEAFLWGTHPVAIYHLRYNTAQNEQSPKFVGINRLSWDRNPLSASDRFATTPNATTLYGQAILDL